MIQLSDKNRAKEIGGNYQQLLNLRFQTDVKIFGTGLNTMVLGKKKLSVQPNKSGFIYSHKTQFISESSMST